MKSGRSLDAEMLMTGLRRNFQTVDPRDFEKLARHFLTKVGFGEEASVMDVRPHTLTSLRQSIQKKNPDPSDAPFRHTLVVDPSDSENGVALLFSLGILHHDTTQVKP